MRRPGTWRFIARGLLSVVVLTTLLLAAQLDEVIGALSRADLWLIAVGVLLNVLTRLTAAERTFVISRSVSLPITRWQTIEAMFISNFWSLALPGVSAGSVVTVYRYTQCGAPLADSVGVLGASRAIELAVFCAFGAAAFALSSSSPNPEVTAALCSVSLVIAGVFFFAPKFAGRAQNAFDERGRPEGMGRRISAIGVRALASFSGAPRAELLTAAGFALVQCALDAASVMALAWSLGLRVDWLDALWINVLAYLAILLPVSLAGLGVREVAVIVALTPLGVSREDAIALALLMFGATLFNALVGGALQLRGRAGHSGV